MKYDLVIFDLDGTILDTLSDLANAGNIALDEMGFPHRTREEIRHFIGGGVQRMLRLAVPKGTDSAIVDRLIPRFKEIYQAHLNESTVPFPGIVKMLHTLRSMGIKTAVNSNKPDQASKVLCEAHFAGLFDLVMGECPGVTKKPDPTGAIQIMEALGVERARTLYVGDSDTDIQTAQNANIDCAWVTWGYRRRDELGNLMGFHDFDTAESLTAFIIGNHPISFAQETDFMIP